MTEPSGKPGYAVPLQTAAVQLGNVIVHLVAVPDMRWQWNPRGTDSSRRLQIIATHITPRADSSSADSSRSSGSSSSSGSSGSSAAAVRDALAEMLPSSLFGGRYAAASFLSRLGSRLPSAVGSQLQAALPAHTLTVHSTTHAALTAATAATTGAAASGPVVGVREVVVGQADGPCLSRCVSVLEAVGAGRDPSNLSLYRLPQQRQDDAPCLRMLPGHYSALICGVWSSSTAGSWYTSTEGQASAEAAGAGAGAGEAIAAVVERVRAYHASTRSAGGRDPIQVHGERRGAPGGAQLLVALPALQGLDLRLCTAPGPLPFFTESATAYDDDVDPALNPPADDPRKAVSLSCQSVVGMEVVSTVKVKLGIAR